MVTYGPGARRSATLGDAQTAAADIARSERQDRRNENTAIVSKRIHGWHFRTTVSVKGDAGQFVTRPPRDVAILTLDSAAREVGPSRLVSSRTSARDDAVERGRRPLDNPRESPCRVRHGGRHDRSNARHFPTCAPSCGAPAPFC